MGSAEGLSLLFSNAPISPWGSFLLRKTPCVSTYGELRDGDNFSFSIWSSLDQPSGLIQAGSSLNLFPPSAYRLGLAEIIFFYSHPSTILAIVFYLLKLWLAHVAFF